MATTLISIEEYLNTAFDGSDREYVDGHIVERNMGEKPHSYAQGEVFFFFRSLGRKGVFAYAEQRVQVKARRFRIPDVCVYVGSDPEDRIFHTPPFLVVEVLSKDDRDIDIKHKIDDYLQFGVKYIWVVDPGERRAYVYTSDGCQEVSDDLWTKDPQFILPMSLLF
jgi:Uma2 family endonuclease